MMLHPRFALPVLIAILALCVPRQASAINIMIDYGFDGNDFFGAGNPDGAAAGAQAKTSLENAAGFLSGILEDTFLAIETPDPLVSQVGTGTAIWSWTNTFINPSSGSQVTLMDQSIAADEYRVYAGARSLSGNAAGVVGSLGSGRALDIVPQGGTFTLAEIDQINATTDAFNNAVDTRGEASGFSSWGQAVAFDNDGSTNWHYDEIALPGAGETDFFSVALHELAHALGVGFTEWDALIAGPAGNRVFTGAAAVAEHGGNVPVHTDEGHWADGTTSTIFGDTAMQEAAMDPTITEGERKLFTNLDAAGLIDIGWEITIPDPPSVLLGDANKDGQVTGADLISVQQNFGNVGATPLQGDANDDGQVTGADLISVQQNFGNVAAPAGAAVPEPASLSVVALGAVCLLARRCTRH